MPPPMCKAATSARSSMFAASWRIALTPPSQVEASIRSRRRMRTFRARWVYLATPPARTCISEASGSDDFLTRWRSRANHQRQAGDEAHKAVQRLTSLGDAAADNRRRKPRAISSMLPRQARSHLARAALAPVIAAGIARAEYSDAMRDEHVHVEIDRCIRRRIPASAPSGAGARTETCHPPLVPLQHARK